MPLKLLDLFCGRWGWSRAFAKRGWDCIGFDLTNPPEVPERCFFLMADVLTLDAEHIAVMAPDFIVASSPCEQFSVFGMKHFHPNPPYPELGIKLFNHTRQLCEASGVPYVMENVRPAQQFVGDAVHHCGPFYLWGIGVPPLMPRGIKKGLDMSWNPETRLRSDGHLYRVSSTQRAAETARIATVPPDLAACVADYAERLIEQRRAAPAETKVRA